VDNNIKKVQRATYTCSLMSSGFHSCWFVEVQYALSL
jgi:hypothetical protein